MSSSFRRGSNLSEDDDNFRRFNLITDCTRDYDLRAYDIYGSPIGAGPYTTEF